MKEYTVEVYDTGDRYWYLNDKLHCEHGPAIEWARGDKSYYLNGVSLSKAQWGKRIKTPCSGKVVDIEGVKYKLVEVSNET